MSEDRIRMLGTTGVVVLPVEVGSDTASVIAMHWATVKRFLHDGNAEPLAGFAGSRISGEAFAVDPAWIETWAARGELDWEDIYEDGGSK